MSPIRAENPLVIESASEKLQYGVSLLHQASTWHYHLAVTARASLRPDTEDGFRGERADAASCGVQYDS